MATPTLVSKIICHVLLNLDPSFGLPDPYTVEGRQYTLSPFESRNGSDLPASGEANYQQRASGRSETSRTDTAWSVSVRRAGLPFVCWEAVDASLDQH